MTLNTRKPCSRTQILNKLRHARSTGSKTAITDVPAYLDIPEEQKVHLLLERFEENKIEYRLCTESSWTKELHKLALDKSLKHWLVGNTSETSEHLDNARKALNNNQMTVTHFDHAYEACRDELFDDIDASLTLAQAAIVETGTLVLIPNRMEPRTMSLIPPVHVVLLRTEKLFSHFQELVESDLWPRPMPTNLLLISSPSKTADIQQTLAYGAHGPKELIVLLIED